ncbi:YggS family pyridoxal phosphate-dependent enzyme [Planctomonas deserti]|uniref:YggS family pyridoxal phosphate-dependent enzyme n=1 Tax=Planctomonas deserti TaxID=2144185 RepID=UPI001F0BAA9B|nr:YggS family pyridoxal phosphate-dependent enzyme [Planctomonas deserti]
MSPDPGLAHRVTAVREAVQAAAREAGRDPAELTTVVVTKFQPVSLVRELAELGMRDVGESRHQEAREKAAELADLSLSWHFVGQLQGKKARQVQRYARVLHSVDRESLLDALALPAGAEAEPGRPETDVFLQVNLTDDPARGGVAPAALESLAERAEAAPGLRLVGVMAVAPREGEPRQAFATLRGLSERVQRIAPDATAISAGMSGDFREAILEGATHLRIGTAITGIRPDPR